MSNNEPCILVTYTFEDIKTTNTVAGCTLVSAKQNSGWVMGVYNGSASDNTISVTITNDNFPSSSATTSSAGEKPTGSGTIGGTTGSSGNNNGGLNSATSTNNIKLGPIIGGVAGVIVIAGIIIGAVIYMKRRNAAKTNAGSSQKVSGFGGSGNTGLGGFDTSPAPLQHKPTIGLPPGGVPVYIPVPVQNVPGQGMVGMDGQPQQQYQQQPPQQQYYPNMMMDPQQQQQMQMPMQQQQPQYYANNGMVPGYGNMNQMQQPMMQQPVQQPMHMHMQGQGEKESGLFAVAAMAAAAGGVGGSSSSSSSSAHQAGMYIDDKKQQVGAGVNIEAWKVEHVVAWLASTGHDEMIVKAFKDNNANGALLRHIATDEQWANKILGTEYHIETSTRLRLIEEIKNVVATNAVAGPGGSGLWAVSGSGDGDDKDNMGTLSRQMPPPAYQMEM
ncbi:hypothetical protein HDU76_013344 [Blyttiomyces sp. JEL0837]|nr:hypothetical protein HDU76_013344 [Blyttiomyces sp. JEL0837]